MATTCEAEAGDEAFELEATRKEDDSSWHPCHVSLSSNGVGLMVDFSGQNQEDIILNKEEALARIRFRSVPLQGDDCSCIKEGERVLATDKSQYKGLYFDAEIEKVLRVRHSKRVHCRCTFVIKWIHQDLKGGTSSVPCSSIMKLSPKAINIHSTIAQFLVSVKSFSFSGASPFTSLLEEMDCELDLAKLVEQQIEGIGNLAVDPSKKETSEYILWGLKDDSTKPNQCKNIKSDVKILPVEVPPGQNHSRRSTRSSSKLQVQMEEKNFPPPAPCILEELPEIRSHLSPLASRAALASIISNHPLKLDFSFNDEVEKKLTSIKENISMNKLSSDLGDATVPFVSDSIVVVKPLISTETGARRNTGLAELSSGIQTEESKNESKNSKVCNSNGNIKGLITGRNLNQPPNSNRITRSAVQKGAQISNDNFQKTPYADGKNLRTSTTTQRLIRSVNCKEQGDISMAVKRGLEGNNLAHSTESDSSEGNIAVVRSNVIEKESSVLTRRKPLQESNKKQKTCTVDTIRQSEGKVSGNGTSSQHQKRKSTSSRKQELRYSPRLRFLPRTRSQNKS